MYLPFPFGSMHKRTRQNHRIPFPLPFDSFGLYGVQFRIINLIEFFVWMIESGQANGRTIFLTLFGGLRRLLSAAIDAFQSSKHQTTQTETVRWKENTLVSARTHTNWVKLNIYDQKKERTVAHREPKWKNDALAKHRFVLVCVCDKFMVVITRNVKG